METLELTLEAYSLVAGTTPQRRREPQWKTVELAIDKAFSEGGTVRLVTSTEVESPRAGHVRRDAVEMLSKPGRYRLVVLPSKKVGERSNQREWWSPIDRPFEGTERFGDDEHDRRTVCTDVRVAKSLFGEFFSSREVTKRLVDDTLSVWTPKPRS